MKTVKKIAKATFKTSAMFVAGIIVPIAMLIYVWGYCNEDKGE